MTNYFIVPGFGGSGSGHWQTYFEEQLPNCQRIQQKSWTEPLCADWTTTIEATIAQYDPSTVVIITHSLGGIALAHWAKEFKRTIKGALIVAPPDIENPYMDLHLQSFTPIPLDPLLFPSIVVASSDDHWTRMDRYNLFATSWGSELINIGPAGHINISSGHGQWDEGLEILKRLA